MRGQRWRLVNGVVTGKLSRRFSKKVARVSVLTGLESGDGPGPHRSGRSSSPFSVPPRSWPGLKARPAGKRGICGSGICRLPGGPAPPTFSLPMPNSFGKLFQITTWGESHGLAIGVVVDGCPPGLPLAAGDIQAELDRRRPGQSDIVTPRKEEDRVEILSGVFEGRTTGTPTNGPVPTTKCATSFVRRMRTTPIKPSLVSAIIVAAGAVRRVRRSAAWPPGRSPRKFCLWPWALRRVRPGRWVGWRSGPISRRSTISRCRWACSRHGPRWQRWRRPPCGVRICRPQKK